MAISRAPAKCRYCGSENLATQKMAAGPHYARVACLDCKRHLHWLARPKAAADRPAPETRVNVFIDAVRTLHGCDCWTEQSPCGMGRAFYARGPGVRIEIIEYDQLLVARRNGVDWQIPPASMRNLAEEIATREETAVASIARYAASQAPVGDWDDEEPMLSLRRRRAELWAALVAWSALAFAAVAALLLLLLAEHLFLRGL